MNVLDHAHRVGVEPQGPERAWYVVPEEAVIGEGPRQPRRVLAAYGGVFIVDSLAWGMAFDDFRPDRYDISMTSRAARYCGG